MKMFSRNSGRMVCSAILALGLTVAALSSWANAEHPPAPELFPKETAAMVRIANAPELAAKFMKTSMGRMSQDEAIGPLFAELFGSATEMFKQVEERVGVTLPELLAVPQGEFAIGLVAPENAGLSFIAILDTGEKVDSGQKLLAKAMEALEGKGLTKNEETVDEIKLAIYDLREPPFKKLILFEKDKTFVAASDMELVKGVLARWKATPGKADEGTLAKNDRYNAIMKRCRGAKDQPPQITFFADPLSIARSATIGDFTATATLALLPTLGLDGFSGVGGSIALDAEPYDYVSHFHVLLENPRSGALAALALGSGDITPPKWVPADVANYTCGYWDFRTTYTQVAKLVDTFRGEGSTGKSIQGFLDARAEGVNFETEILDQLAGRVMHFNWMEPPARLMSDVNCVAIQVKDPEAARKILEKLAEKYKDNTVVKTIAKTTYYEGKQPPIAVRRRTERAERGEREPPTEEVVDAFPMPCVAVVADNLVITRAPLLKKIVLAMDDPQAKSLADSPEYKLVAGRFDRVAAGAKPGMITFSQPEQGMRWVYDFATSENSKKFLENPDAPEPVKRLNDALAKHPLPPFSVIQKYLAPTGGVMINEPTGFHYTGFGLRRTGGE